MDVVWEMLFLGIDTDETAYWLTCYARPAFLVETGSQNHCRISF